MVNPISAAPQLPSSLLTPAHPLGQQQVGPLGDARSTQELFGPESTERSTPDFRDFLVDSIDHVNGMQQDADKAVESLLTGGDVSPAQVMVAIQKADMSFRMLQQVRNKLVQAYQEIKDIRI